MSFSDSDDDFVEVDGNGYQSSDSAEWEKISGYGSATEELFVVPTDSENVQATLNVDGNTSGNVPPQIKCYENYIHEKGSGSEEGRSHSRRTRRQKDRKKNWQKMTLKHGEGAPYDPVELLGINGKEKDLLVLFGINTIGQLAYCNPVNLMSRAGSENFAIILDLQERAYKTVVSYAKRISSQPETVWGYVYLGPEAVKQMLKKGHLESDSLVFLYTPMPTMTYRDQLAIDDLMGTETNNRVLRTRYSRFVKINLTTLCDTYYARLFQKDPTNVAVDKWQAISLVEAGDLAQREDLWFAHEAGNELYGSVLHGSIVVPTGRIPKECIELDKETCSFSNTAENDESDDEGEASPHPLIAKALDMY